MDIQHLVDRLEDLIDEGRHMPFSKYTMIDEERVLEIIDQMRISIPEEIEKSARILQQRDRVLAQANEEAARILQQARQKGNEMLDEDVNVQAAQNRAANLIEQARQQAAQMTGEADHYVMSVLSKLEQNLLRNLNQVRNGISEVNHAANQPQPAAVTGEDEIQGTPAEFPQPQQNEEQRESISVSLKRRDDIEQG